jgi:arginyl-tRNA synthetase
MESFDRAKQNVKSSYEQRENKMLERAKTSLQGIREELDRVRWRIDEYCQERTLENWKKLLTEIELLNKTQSTVSMLTFDLTNLRNSGETGDGWPPGSFSWRK